MKNLKLIVFGISLFLTGTIQAQVLVNVNIGSPPNWGPAGYADNVRYYYLPDVEAYYDIQNAMFIYDGGSGIWIHRAHLPFQYRNYDLYGGYKVVMVDYWGNYPYSHHKEYKIKYAHGYRGPEQRNIGNNHHQNNYQSNGNYDNNYNRQEPRIISLTQEQ